MFYKSYIYFKLSYYAKDVGLCVYSMLAALLLSISEEESSEECSTASQLKGFS